MLKVLWLTKSLSIEVGYMNFLMNVSLGDIGNIFSSFSSVVKSVFSDFSIADVVDILLLSVILFFAFRFIRGRKAGAYGAHP